MTLIMLTHPAKVVFNIMEHKHVRLSMKFCSESIVRPGGTLAAL